MRGTFPTCCARARRSAASGNAATALPSVMNSRLFIALPSAPTAASHQNRKIRRWKLVRGAAMCAAQIPSGLRPNRVKDGLNGSVGRAAGPPSRPALNRREAASSLRASGREQVQQADPLLDHLVGGGEQRWRQDNAEHACRLMVVDELELRRLLDWQVCRFRSLEDPAGIEANLTIRIPNVCSMSHQTADFGEF